MTLRLPLFLAVLLPLSGCSDETSSGSSSSSSTSGGGGSTSVSTSATTSTGSDNVCGGAIGAGDCAPEPSCAGAASSCLAPPEACDSEPRLLRMSELAFTKPAPFASGTMASIIANLAKQDLKECHLNGQGTLSWLLEIDAAKSTLKTGTAKLGGTPAAGYCFDNGTIDAGGTTYTIVPTIVPATVGGDGLLDAEVIDTINILVDLGDGASFIPLPLSSLRFHDAKLSADGACIGAFNVAGLKNDNLCLPDQGAPSFVGGGTFDGYITLEDADAAIVSTLDVSLCVLITGDAGDGASPKRCSRTNGVIDAKGDWCKMSDHAATATCFDAMQVSAAFAASAVVRRGGC